MEYTKLGNTDIEISKLCVGCMSFGKAGTSEEYLGRALKKHVARDKVVIASKVYFNPGRLSAEAIHREIDGTLKRLGTDYLDLYIIHRFAYETPIEETMEEPYVPHRIVGAIDHNPEDGVMLVDVKK